MHLGNVVGVLHEQMHKLKVAEMSTLFAHPQGRDP